MNEQSAVSKKSKSSRAKAKQLQVFFFDLEAFYSEQGLNWDIVVTASALCRMGGVKLNIVSLRDPHQISQMLVKWQEGSSWQDNVKNLIAELKQISLSRTLSDIVSCGVIVDHICSSGDVGKPGNWYPHQIQLESDLICFLEKSLSQSKEFSVNDVKDYIKSHAVYKAFKKKSSEPDKSPIAFANQFSEVLNAYPLKGQEIKPEIYFVGMNSDDTMAFGQLKFTDCISKAYLLNNKTKSEIVNDLGLGRLAEEYLAGKVTPKTRFICLLSHYLFWDLGNAPHDQEKQLTSELIETIPNLEQLMKIEHLSAFMGVLALRLPDYTNQLIIKITHSQYPFGKKDSIYAMPEEIDTQQNEDSALISRSASESNFSGGFSHDSNNNDNVIPVRKTEKKRRGKIVEINCEDQELTHFRNQKITTYGRDDFAGTDLEDFLKRCRYLIKAAYNKLEQEENALLTKSKTLTEKAQSIIIQKANLLSLQEKCEKYIESLWTFSDYDFKDENGHFAPTEETKVRFDKFYKKALRLLKNLTKVIAGIMVDNASLTRVKEYIKELEAIESKYIDRQGRPLLLNKLPLNLTLNNKLPDTIERTYSSFWHLHVSVGRYTYQQFVHHYFKEFNEAASKNSFNHLSFNKALRNYLSPRKKDSPFIAGVLKNISENMERDAKLTLKYVIESAIQALEEGVDNRKVYLYYLDFIYEALAKAIDDILKVGFDYTSPSTERGKEGLCNFIETRAFRCNGEEFKSGISGHRSSSPPAIDADPKSPAGESATRLLMTMRNIEQEIAVYTNKLLKEGKLTKGTGDHQSPYYVPIAWASLLSPFGGAMLSELFTGFAGKQKESEHRQLYETDKVRKMLESEPVLVEIEGKKVWVQIEIFSINVPVNDGVLRTATDSLSDLHNTINAEGLWKVASRVDKELHLLVNSAKESKEKKSKFKALKKAIAELDKNRYLNELNASINNTRRALKEVYVTWRRKLEALKLKALTSEFDDILTNYQKDAEKLRKQIGVLEDNLQRDCQDYLKKRASILFDFESELDEVAKELNDLREDATYKNDKVFQRLADIFELQAHVFRMYHKRHWDTDDNCYWFVSYFMLLMTKLMELILRWHCKSGEDRTGALEDILRSIEEIATVMSHYPDYRQDLMKTLVNLVRQQLHEKGVCRRTNGYNGPGDGLQLHNTWAYFDLKVAKLPKQVFKLSDGDVIFPKVTYEYPPKILNKARAATFNRDSFCTGSIIEANNEFKVDLDADQLVKVFSNLKTETEEYKVNYDIFCNDLILRFWYCIFEIADVGYNVSLLKDMEFYLVNMLKFSEPQRELLEGFFYDRCSSVLARKNSLKGQFSALMTFLDTSEETKTRFSALFQKSLCGTSSYSFQMPIELLKEKYASVSLAEVRYVLPWFYHTGKNNVQDYENLTTDIGEVLKVFKGSDRFGLGSIVSTISRAVSDLDLLTVSSDNLIDAKDSNQNAGSVLDVTTQFQKAKKEFFSGYGALKQAVEGGKKGSSTESTYLSRVSSEIIKTFEMLEELLATMISSQEVLSTSKAVLVETINAKTKDLAGELTTIQSEYGISANFEQETDGTNHTLQHVFERFLDVISEGLLSGVSMNANDDNQNMKHLTDSMIQIFVDSHQKYHNLLQTFDKKARPKVDYSNDFIQHELNNAMSKLPSADSYSPVDFFEVTTISEMQQQGIRLSENSHYWSSDTSRSSTPKSNTPTKPVIKPEEEDLQDPRNFIDFT